MLGKPKLSMYWAASCGGCEISVVNLHEKILDIDAAFDFMFCPCLLDTKKKDIEAMPDKGIAITLFNGAIRTEENEEMARLLRRKSKLLIAFGSCSYEGCIPGLGNLTTGKEMLETVYTESPSTHNPGKIIPRPVTDVPEGKLHIPAFLNKVKVLKDVVDVDYFIPGCPPEPHRIWDVVETVILGNPLPAVGSVIGTGNSTVCEECARKKEDKKVKRFYRTYEIIPDKEKCLLEQGIICMGIATRGGCGGLCPKVNMPCTGCYGTPAGVHDQGAKMIAALGSILDVGESKGLSEDELIAKVDGLLDPIPDPAGLFYKFSLPHSILKGKIE
jgi:F420-non-reducing hydrogenase small subunit